MLHEGKPPVPVGIVDGINVGAAPMVKVSVLGGTVLKSGWELPK